MLSAISSLLTKTIDVFLKINSAESRRHRFGKDVFAVYNALDQVADALDAITTTVRQVAGLTDEQWPSTRQIPDHIITRSWSSDGTVELQTYELAPDGSEQLSPVRRVKYTEILPSILSSDLRRLNRAFGKVAGIMSAESWDLFQLEHQPDKLKALGIFDDDVVRTFTRAWFDDGGFVEALHHLGLDQELDGKVLKLVDAEFDPRTSPHGYEVEGEETKFSLNNPDDVASFLALTARCKASVENSRDVIKKFIAKNYAIEDIL